MTAVTAPLVSYHAHQLHLTLPCAVANAEPAANRILVTTVPTTAPGFAELGLLVQTAKR